MSVTVGFSQATTALIVPASGTTRPDGTPADGAAPGGGEIGLFAALLAMLAPGAQPTPEADTPFEAGKPAVTGSTIVPTDTPTIAPPVTPPASPDLTGLTQSEPGKALLKDFTAALKAAKTALDEGKPLDPALETKLRETVDAVAAFVAGQPLLQPAAVDTSKLSELASGSAILPATPDTSLPPAADGETAPPAAPPSEAATPTAAASTGGVVQKFMQAQPVPAQLGELGNALKDFAAQLDKVSPDLAKALGKLAERLGVGDIADDAMTQLGLTRSPGSTSPELGQVLAALAGAAATRPATTAPGTSAIAAPVLDVPDVLAGATQAADTPDAKPKKADAPPPEAARPDAAPLADDAARTEPLHRAAAGVTLRTEAVLEPAAKVDDKPAGVTAQATKPADTPAPVANPAVANPDAAALAAQPAAAARAIHAAYAAPVQQLNLPQVAFEVARHFEAGNTRFQIRLDPAELGRIDVKLDLDKNGTVNARLFVERPETLDLMMRDQRALQQALQQAGLDTSKTSLEFSLRQNPFAGSGGEMGQGGSNGGQPGFGPFGAPVADEGTELAAQSLYRGSASASGVNLFV